jgi:Lrp/AsnC family transcriptional regulator for asnA, asnC and gidA
MDELDRRIVAELQSDSRKSNARLAKSLGISEPTVSRRIERLVSSNDLVFSALPDMKLFGYTTSAYIGLRIRQSARSLIAEQLCLSPCLRFVSACEGFADFFVGGDFTSTEKLADFITGYLGKIDGVIHIDTMVELKQLKKRSYGLQFREVSASEIRKAGNIACDEANHRLIIELQKDCRTPLKKLACELHMSEPTVYRHIKNLVVSGAIQLTVIATQDLYRVQDIIGIEADPLDLERVASSISHFPQVQHVGIYSGPIQILAGIYSSSYEDLSHFTTHELVKTEGITRVALIGQLKVLKRGLPWIRE